MCGCAGSMFTAHEEPRTVHREASAANLEKSKCHSCLSLLYTLSNGSDRLDSDVKRMISTTVYSRALPNNLRGLWPA
eukprot:10322-Heterococcus_DN1.PRE.1